MRLKQAELLVDRGKIKEAADLLGMVARQDPRNARARLLLLGLPATLETGIDRQKLINELRAIEGEVGLNWRLAQATEWMRV